MKKETGSFSVVIIDSNQKYGPMIKNGINANANANCILVDSSEEDITQILGIIKQNRPCMIFIAAETRIGAATGAASHTGIDILKHVRLTDELGEIRNVPIVIYSLRNREALFDSRPENVVIFSRGCYFYSMFELNKALAENFLYDSEKDVVVLGPDTLHKIYMLDHLKPYIKADIKDSLYTDRHSIANWWGPQRLLLGYILADPEKQSAIAEQNPVMIEFQRLKETLAVKEFLFLKDSRAAIDKKQRRVIIQEYNSELPNFLTDQRINALITNRKVLYIDDEASTGWADAFKQILYPMGSLKPSDKSKNKFSVKQSDKEVFVIYQSFELAARELNRSSLKEFSLIMLDLRDKEKDKQTNRPEELTGMRLLKQIRNPKSGDPSIPILMVTASNKLWNYEKVLELGANAYWIKESPEYGIDDEYTLRNYLKLRNELLTLLCLEPSLRIVWRCITDCEDELNRRIKLNRPNVTLEIRQAYGEIILLLKKGFEMLSSMKSLDLYLLRGITTLLGAAWEKYRGRDNLKQLWKYEEKGNRANIVDLFLVTLRCWFVHGKAKANEITIDDIVNMYIWFRNLIMQQEKYMELEGIERQARFPRYYVEVAGKKCFRERDDNEDLISTYKSFWNFLAATMSASDLQEDDCQRIRKRFNLVM